MKRRLGNYCMLGKDYTEVLSAESSICRAQDFECDYGYERRREGNCLPAFWFNPAVVSRCCSQGQKYLNSTGYRKVVSNNCVKGVKDMYTPRKQMCPNRAPKGLSLSTREGKLTADLHTNVTFLVHLDEPVISLDGSISYTFTSEGMNTVTVQASSENAILQDTKTIAVQEFFKSLLLSFSGNLD
ncbi:VPS10 domain-containing receptor SorCS1-like [Oncorhynchus masou masou]|uniref:VPS10 domain-containing receptor SorCS1-like n=1 Tax=Oncorhynchus masou masou TaxID=90313 RepID=UPI003184039D